jgi:hypothetical protein
MKYSFSLAKTGAVFHDAEKDHEHRKEGHSEDLEHTRNLQTLIKCYHIFTLDS